MTTLESRRARYTAMSATIQPHSGIPAAYCHSCRGEPCETYLVPGSRITRVDATCGKCGELYTMVFWRTLEGGDASEPRNDTTSETTIFVANTH